MLLLEKKELIKINKNYLSSPDNLRTKIFHLESKLQRFRYLSVNISPTANSCYVKKDKTLDRSARIMDNIVDLEREIISTELQLSELLDEISFKISLLDSNDQQMVLFYRYIDKLPFKVIAVNMNYSESNIFSIHRNALIKFSIDVTV